MSTAARLDTELEQPGHYRDRASRVICFLPAGTNFSGWWNLWDEDDIAYKRDDFVPDGVKVVKEKAILFNPQENKLTTDKGTVISYDYLILATGLHLDFERIKGLEEAGRAYVCR